MKRWDARKKCPNEIVCFTPGGELLRNFKLLLLPLDFGVSSVERWGRLGLPNPHK